MVSTHIGDFHCPFREFHCFPDGKDESKGISRMMSHLKTLHLCTDEHKNTTREAFSIDPYLFTEFEETSI